MKIIGHRGAPCEALENSSESFSCAVEAGCHMIELDVWKAKDHTFWVSHDNSLERTAKRSEKISSLVSEELSQVRLLNGEPLLELGSCLDKILPHVDVNIELKDEKSEIVPPLLDLLSSIKQKEKLVLSCFHLEPLEAIEEKDSNLQLALLWEENNSYSVDPLDYLKDHSKWFFHPQADRLYYSMVQALLEDKRILYPWVSRFGVEDTKREKFWKLMLDFGVHGLCTNYPREFSKWLSQQRSL